MEKMRMETPDQSLVNVEKIGALFPNCITETTDNNGKLKKAISFDLLRQMLSGDVVEGDEVYEFSWVGKKASIAEANKPTRKALRPCPEKSVDWDNTENLYIEGDNLEVLKLLQESYLGKVKMIYIDPPYNTGNDFVYKDDFAMSLEDYEDDLGVYDLDGNRLFKNTEANGRFHSDWCSMIYSRLLLARGLLRDDGVIFISIDDNEVDNLIKIGNEVFGEENFIALIPWRKRTAKSDVPFGISQDYEEIICFAKSTAFFASVEGKGRKYYESDDFPGRPWRVHDLTKQTTASERPNSYFTIVNPKTGDEYPANPNATWRITADTFEEYYQNDRIVFPGDYPFLRISKPVLRYWKEDDMKKAGEKFGRVAVSTKLPDDIGMSQDGTKEITELFGRKVFNFPKPTSLIKFLVSVTTEKNDLVMDFFSGSGTTADAVMQANANDGGRRKYILIQLPEAIEKNTEAHKANLNNICELARTRIQLAGKQRGIPESVDIGFRTLKLDESNMNDIYYAAGEYTQDLLTMLESNVKPGRTDLDLLFGCLLEWGLPLSMPYKSEIIEGYTVHTYNDGDLIACFDEDISDKVIKEIARRQPLRAVFRDSSFNGSPAKINVGEIFKMMAPDTRVKVI